MQLNGKMKVRSIEEHRVISGMGGRADACLCLYKIKARAETLSPGTMDISLHFDAREAFASGIQVGRQLYVCISDEQLEYRVVRERRGALDDTPSDAEESNSTRICRVARSGDSTTKPRPAWAEV